MNTPDLIIAAEHPETWPCWPLLPIKNKRGCEAGEFPRLGALVATSLEDDAELRFVEGSMFAITEEQVMSAPKADVRQLAADGWVVD